MTAYAFVQNADTNSKSEKIMDFLTQSFLIAVCSIVVFGLEAWAVKQMEKHEK